MRRWLLGLVVVLVAAESATPKPKLKTVKEVKPGAGLTGGGTGPSVTLGIQPGGITAAHLSLAARDVLKGDSGEQGPPGPQGPAGPQGVQGPAGAGVLAVEHFAPIGRREIAGEPFPADMAFQFNLTEPRFITARTQAAFVSNSGEVEVTIAIFVDDQRIATTHGRGRSGKVDTYGTSATVPLDAGPHTVEVELTSTHDTSFGNADGRDDQTFLEVVIH